MPIHTLLESGSLQAGKLEIKLVSTPSTFEKAALCLDWLKNQHPDLELAPTVYFQDSTAFWSELAKNADDLYLNVNPAMQWQVALACLRLPKTTLCLASDHTHCYLWKLTDDIQKCSETELPNIGLENLVELSEDISLDIRPSERNNRLSREVAECLDTLKSDEKKFLLKLPDKNNHVHQRINERLIWVDERKGRLRLLLDMTEDKDNGDLLEDFRLINAVFPPLYYEITIASYNTKIIKRAEVEGLDCIRVTRNKKWHGEISDWVKGHRTVKPKSVVPEKSRANLSMFDLSGSIGKSPLFVCMGDNIEPTIKAILSHTEADSVGLFYDKASARIDSLATKLALFGKFKYKKKITLLPTDHKGHGMLEKISEIAPKCKTFSVNVTPGTKLQTVALASAARNHAGPDNTFSIYRNNASGTETIRRVVDSQDCAEVASPDMEDLLDCLIADFKHAGREVETETERILSLDLWDKILSDISENKIHPFDSFENFQVINESYPLEIMPDSMTVKSGNDTTFQLNENFFGKDGGGTWWEAVVAHAIKKALGAEVYMQLEWAWPGRPNSKGVHYAEIDVVTTCRKHILAISCKTMKQGADIAAYAIKSETSNRFGRFAIPLLALPHEEIMGENIAGQEKDGVTVLTPSLLTDADNLKKTVESVIISRSTTLI